MSIKVQNVSKLYGEQKALDQVSFEVKAGEIVGFLGPNGAGKSTMMKIITAFLPATEGKVEVNGLDVNEDPLKIKSQIGYLAEQNPLYYDMYVKEYLQFTAGIYKIDNVKERIAEMIQLVGLEKEQHKKIGALSKGYKQRVGLAQALIHDPSVLILDEPTTGLDPNQLEEIRSLIKEIGAKKTVMLSTHIMQEVEAICERVIIVDHGKIVANSQTEELGKLFGPTTIVEVEFDKKANKASLQKIEGVTKAESTDGLKWKVQHDPQIDIRNAIFQLAVKEEMSVLAMQQQKTSVEEVFKQLTRRQTQD
ncbi:MAG: gliding motility-associated ABC transporter ATP-binding subunit GldA [Flavobacteriales bacterium]|nr:gliding motility-associated ABC transporter ATP-binding subunit GldA [Flavobacteriales bacterium]